MNRLSTNVAAGLAALLLAAPLPAAAGHVACGAAMSALNPDGDGTIDGREARRAAKRLFYALDPDRDGTLDRNELRGRVGLLSFLRFNPDRDGTLDLREYLALVEHRFQRANPDNDGTIDCAELDTIAGRRLLQVLM